MRFSILLGAAAALFFSSPAVAAPSASPSEDCSSPKNPYTTGKGIREIFSAFVEEFYFQRDFAGAADKYIASNLIQHNPQIANGRDAEVAAVSSILTKYDGPNFELLLVDEQRGYGVVFNRFVGKPGTGIPLTVAVDIYRFDGSCMVEHWDAIEALPANSTNPDPF
jgi:predicted SnoaL-like aldol condensation-catalyzing enzyme